MTSNILKLNKDDKILIGYYRAKATILSNIGDIDSALYYYNNAYEISQKLNNENEKAISLFEKSIILKNHDRFLEALYSFTKAIASTKNANDFILAIKSSLNKAMTFLRMGNYVNAYEIAYDALKIAKNIDDTYWIIESNVVLGNLSTLQKNFDKVLYHYYRALNFSKQIRYSLGNILAGLGYYYFNSNQFDSALFYHKKVLALNNYRVLKCEISPAVYYNVGETYLKLFEYDSALQYLN